ncbi:MAG: hypothetical protein ACOCWI_05145 [Bacillota bacterium]
MELLKKSGIWIMNWSWRLLLFIPLMLLTPFRIVNIIPFAVGSVLIFFDKRKYGRILGWLLSIAALVATIILYVVYSVEGGLMY